MTNVKLSAPDARRIAAGLLERNAAITESSSKMAQIADDLSVAGMQGLAGAAVARKQRELDAKTKQLVATSEEKAHGLNDYANLVEASQDEDAASVNSVGA